MPREHCPDLQQLVCLAVGTLPAAQLPGLAEHVEACPRCEQHLSVLDTLSEPLLDCLRRPFADGDASDCVSPQLLERVRASVERSALPPDTGLGPGSRLGRFELLDELGVGSFGQVFRAWDHELERTVAIKIPRFGKLSDAAERERFLREARSIAQLQHPGVVALHEIGQRDDGSYFLVEEFIGGTTLSRRLAEGSLEPRAAAALLLQAAEALHYAHQHGVIHRDLKPANILLDPEGRPHVADFGLAKRDTDETPLTFEGQVLGTPAYMSPEQARGEANRVDARTDVYSLGVILYEMLTGERPFRGNRRMLLLQVINDEPRSPRRLNDRVPRDLETICLQCLAKSPQRRYGSAYALAEDLRRFLAGEPIRARPAGRLPRLSRWCRRHPLVVSLFLAVTLGSAVGLVHLSQPSRDLVRSAALESAAQHSEILDVVNNRYSSEVVERVQSRGGVARADYREEPGAIPIPATFTIDLGQHLAKQSESGVQVRLYSDYPFKTRKDGGPRDEFEREALQQLRDQPDRPYYRFEEFQNKPVLRYATARRMGATCLRCHNHHPDSMRTDWQEGDVRGVLEIIRPLEHDMTRTQEGLRGTFLLMAAVSGLLFIAGVAMLILGARRRDSVAL
jgi:serine/threonine protein kinase